MKSMNVHKVVVKQETYDVVSANTEFYAFINDKLYYTFDKFVVPEDLEVFKDNLMGDDGYFVVGLTDIEGGGDFLVKVQPCEQCGCVELRLYNIDILIGEGTRLKQSLAIRNAILELYNDAYFEYSVATDKVRLYYVSHFEHDIAEYTLDEFEEKIKEQISESDMEQIDAFVSAMRQGKREFGLTVNSDLIETGDKSATLYIKGSAIYSGGEYICATGSIHSGRERNASIRKKIERDSLTGVLAKAEITSTAINTIDVKKVNNVTLAIIDIDYFKKVNDTYGHQMGDEVLKRVAAMIEEEVGNSGVVGRFGGDEFFVLFYDAEDMENSRERLRSLKNMVNSTFPANNDDKPTITLSIGCATFPKDADNYEDVFMLADFALYRAKEKGRNRYIIYSGDKHGSLDDIKESRMTGNRINNRGDMSISEVLCVMMDKVYNGEEYSIQKLLDDIVVNSPVQRIMVYAGKPAKAVYMAGEMRPSEEVIESTQNYLDDEQYMKMLDTEGFLVINDITYMEVKNVGVHKKMQKQGIRSLMQFKFNDKNGVPCVISYEAVSAKLAWSQSEIHYYRLFAKLLSEYELV